MGYKVISTEMSTKELLDKSAAELMAEHGEKFSVRDICKKAGVSVGTFYTYYKSKDEICMERLRYMDMFLELTHTECLCETQGEQLTQFLLRYLVRSAQRGLSFSREVYRGILMCGVTEEQAHARRFFQITRDIIAKGQQEGEFSSAVSADTLADMTIAFARGLAVDWCHKEGAYDIESFAKQACEVWVAGLKNA